MSERRSITLPEHLIEYARYERLNVSAIARDCIDRKHAGDGLTEVGIHTDETVPTTVSLSGESHRKLEQLDCNLSGLVRQALRNEVDRARELVEIENNPETDPHNEIQLIEGLKLFENG